MKSWYLPDDTVEAVLEPLEGLSAGDLVVGAEGGLAAAALGDVLTGTGPIKVSLSLPPPLFHFFLFFWTDEHSHAAVEVHTVDTNTGVVLDTQVNVLADTETEVTGLGEVALSQLVLLDLEATLENLLGLGATDGNVDGDLFVTTDTEGTDGVTGLAYSHTNQISARSFFLQKFLTEVSLL